jgi:D-arabinose 1-dehydrogenase-like Zn-dependent alcohol dehydrogenase
MNGGLGHLVLQFASKMGFRTVAINRGEDEEGFYFSACTAALSMAIPSL